MTNGSCGNRCRRCIIGRPRGAGEDLQIATAQATAQAAASTTERPALTPEQRAIVEYGDGPLVVIAGAGTGKTRVIVERVRHLLATHEDLLPENLLVLTYNVKAARELRERIETAVGAATAARLTVANFHSFCHRVLTESGPEVGLPARPDVLDGIGQFLMLREICPKLTLIYHSGEWAYGDLVRFINRAKDELVTPDDFDAFVAREREVFEDRYGSYADAAAGLLIQGNLRPVRDVRSAYARLRRNERAEELGQEVEYDPADVEHVAEKTARRAVGGSGKLVQRKHFTPEQLTRIDELAATYVTDGAALEVMRWSEIASVYRAYQEAIAERGALDFGEQIAAVTQLFKARPNILRRWQRQFRYLLVDEFQDANIAQIELIELLGRTPDRPDNVMVVGDDDQSIYRFRGASFAAFAEFERRFSRPPAHAPDSPPPGKPPIMRIEENFRSTGAGAGRRQPADRAQRHPLRTGQAAAHQSRRRQPGGGGGLRRGGGRGGGDRGRHAGAPRGRHALVGDGGPVSEAPAPRGHCRPAPGGGHPVHGGGRPLAVRHAGDPGPGAGPARHRGSAR